MAWVLLCKENCHVEMKYEPSLSVRTPLANSKKKEENRHLVTKKKDLQKWHQVKNIVFRFLLSEVFFRMRFSLLFC